MKKQIRKSIVFKKTIIANIETKNIYGGFVNPDEPSDPSDCPCVLPVSQKDGHDIILTGDCFGF